MTHLYKIRRGQTFKHKGKVYFVPMEKQRDPEFWYVQENDERGKREYFERNTMVEPL